MLKVPQRFKKVPQRFQKVPQFVKEFSKVAKKFHPKSCSQANLSKMNQNETKCPKIDEVDQDSKNLVEQIEQNEL